MTGTSIELWYARVPIAKLYQHGFTQGTPPRVPNRTPPKRSTIGGWSAGSCRRNTAFLRSVLERELPILGVTFTLTVRNCPVDAAAWERMRRAYIERLRRAGMICGHWVTEWQRRGVPHLHGIVYFPGEHVDGELPESVGRALASWLQVAESCGAAATGQHFALVHDIVGWLQYLAKHASRGVSHYQRNPANVPRSWHGRTGRVWGHVGDWPIRAPIALELQNDAAHTLRRWVRNWRIADARSEPDRAKRRRRIRSARRMLRCPDRARSSVRGISEWIRPELTDRMLQALHRAGHPIDHR